MQFSIPANVLKIGESLHFGKQLFTLLAVRSDCNMSICKFNYLYFCCWEGEMFLVFAYLLFSKPALSFKICSRVHCLYWLLTLLQSKYLKCYTCI